MSEKKVEIRASDGSLIRTYYETREDVVIGPSEPISYFDVAIVVIVFVIPAIAIAGVFIFFLIAALSMDTSRPQVNTNRQMNVVQTGEALRYVNTPSLNLRSSPGQNTSVIKTLPRDYGVIVTTETMNVDGSVWVKVRTPSGTGWVNRKHLR